MISAFDHPWLGGLFGDAEAQAIWSPERQLARMIAFEAAWSRALGATGAADPETAEAAARAIESWPPDITLLREGTARDGLPVPALAAALREEAGAAAGAVHRDTTSQDVIDTALALALKDSADLLETRLAALENALADLTRRFGATEITGRTRMQDALPIAAATRLAAWAQPLPRHRTRLAEIRPRVEIVQIGGAVGDRRGLPEDQVAHVAQALGLAPGPCWHTARDGVAEFAALLALVAGSCGKIGQDAALMAQAGEIGLAGGGGSSAMPHKQNPVRAELLVTLARFAAGEAASAQHALVHEQERSGTAWALEWMVLPGLATAATRAIGLAADLARNVERIG